jgi:hypothetical protein
LFMTRSLGFLFRETTELMLVCIYTEIVIRYVLLGLLL